MSTASVPQVHLIVALDAKIPKGALLQALEQLRCQFWQEEVVLFTEPSWEPYLGPEYARIIYGAQGAGRSEGFESRVSQLDHLLNQLDELSLFRVSILGDLGSARWLNCYFESRHVPTFEVLSKLDGRSWAFMNQLTRVWKLAVEGFAVPSSRKETVVIDPYHKGQLSPDFLRTFLSTREVRLPAWIRIITEARDRTRLKRMGLGAWLEDAGDYEVSFQDCRLVSFDHHSARHLRSRMNRICLVTDESLASLVVPGDIRVQASDTLDAVELVNVINAWRTNRLPELANQMTHLNTEITELRIVGGWLSEQSIQVYAQEQLLVAELLKLFKVSQGRLSERDLDRYLHRLSDHLGLGMPELAVSTKVLALICQRMRLSLSKGERLFHRLGSDYGRIRLGEIVCEELFNGSSSLRLTDQVSEPLSRVSRFIESVDKYAEAKLNQDLFKESA